MGTADKRVVGDPDRTSKGGDGGGIGGIAGEGDEKQQQHEGVGRAPTLHACKGVMIPRYLRITARHN